MLLGEELKRASDFRAVIINSEGIKEKEAQIRAYNEFMREVQDRIDYEMWLVVDGLEGAKDVDQFNSKKLITIKLFLKKLPLHEVLEAAEIAQSKLGHNKTDEFKYFCGICWNKIRGGQDA